MRNIVVIAAVLGSWPGVPVISQAPSATATLT